MQLSEAIELFLAQYKPSSQRTYRQPLTDFMNTFVAPSRQLETITKVDCVGYMNAVWAREEISSPVTYNKYVITLRTFFNWCINMDLIEKSPALAIKKKSTRGTIPKVKAMSRAKIDKLLSWCKMYAQVGGHNPLRPLALISFLVDTGCRIGGVAGLTRDNIVLDSGFKHKQVTTYVARLYEKNSPHDANIYYFTESTANIIREYLLSHQGEYVFSSDGSKISAPAYSDYFRDKCIKAGIGSWGPHSLRHAKGYHGADNLPPELAARVLNISQEVYQRSYTQKHPQFVREAAALLLEEPRKNYEIIQLNETG